MAERRLVIEWEEGSETFFKPGTKVQLKEREGTTFAVPREEASDNLKIGDKVKFLPHHDCLTVKSMHYEMIGDE